MKNLEALFGAIQVGFTLILSPFLRNWYNRWGATSEELTKTLPGDELVPVSRLGYTRAIEILASPERVWSWLVQIGQGRAGLYSYDGLENLVGCDIHSVNEILPEYQSLQPGDMIRMGPEGFPCFRVISVDIGRALILIGADPKTGEAGKYRPEPEKGYSIATWQFILESKGKDHTRLLARQRMDFSPDMTWIWQLTEPVAFVMERNMLLGIRQRAMMDN